MNPLHRGLFGHSFVENPWPLLGICFYGVSATHARLKNDPREDLRELYIEPARAERDVKDMKHWVIKLGVSCDKAKVYYHTTEGGDRATARNILKVFKQLPADTFTIVYMALHTEVVGEPDNQNAKLGFLAADYTSDDVTPGSPGVVPYSDVTGKLTSAFERGSSVLLITESCHSINIMQLPYKCWVRFVANEPQIVWEETQFPDKPEWKSKPLTAQSAATEPGSRAAHFSSGALYTQALCKAMNPDSPHHVISFRDVMIKIQTLMNKSHQCSEPTTKPTPQVHVLYCSRKIEDKANFWSAFKLKSLGSPACVEH